MIHWKNAGKKNPGKWLRRVLLAALFALALAVRLLRAHQLAIISPDAIRYILQAQALTIHPVRAMREEVYHPFFSVCILAVHAALQGLHLAGAGQPGLPDRIAWALSAQTVGIVCGALVAPLIYALGRQWGARFWPALAGATLFILTKRTSAYGIEADSDTLALALFAASMLLAMRAIRFRHGAFSRRSALRLAIAGLFGGLAYLTRPEGLAAPLLILVTLACWWLRGKSSGATLKFLPRRTLSTKTFLPAATILLVFTAVPALPYMLTIRGLTHKKQLTLAPAPPNASPAPIKTLSGARTSDGHASDARHPPPVPQWILDEVAKTCSTPCFILLILGLAFHLGLSGRPRLRLLAFLWLLLWVGLMFWLLRTAGYLSGRHTLPLQLLLFSWFGIALQGWQRLAQWGFARLQIHKSLRLRPATLFAAALFLLVALYSVLQLSSPPLGDQDASIALTVPWAKDHLRRDVFIADRQQLVGYFSGNPFTRWLGTAQNPALDTLATVTAGPHVLGILYEPGDPIPPALGPYLPLATFQIPHTRKILGETYILYSLPNAPVLK